MRKITLLLSMLVVTAMALTACGGGATSTNVAPTIPPITAEVTEPATEMPTEMPTEPMATETAGVPVTGEINPARISNELQFSVVDQTGNQVGNVQDMILDLDNTSVAYVIVNADGGTLGTGREVAVPWDMLQLQTGTDTGTGTGMEATAAPTDAGMGEATAAPTDTSGMATGEATVAPTDSGMATAAPTDAGSSMGISGQHVFILQTDPNALANAPEFDPGTLPQMGQPASGWDADLLSYWQGAGTGTGSGTNSTPAPDMTATTDTGTGGTGTGSDTTGTATAAPTDAGSLGSATAAPTDASGAGMGTGMRGALQGVALASDVIGSTVTVNSMGTGTGTEATAAPTGAGGTGTDMTGTGAATAAPTDASGAGMGTGTTENVSGTVEDLIVDTDSGNILYIVLNATLDSGERVIPVLVSMFQWDGSTQGLVLNTDAVTLQNAPNFEGGQYPDTTMSGWNSEFDSYWQNNGGGSGSNSVNGTATP